MFVIGIRNETQNDVARVVDGLAVQKVAARKNKNATVMCLVWYMYFLGFRASRLIKLLRLQISSRTHILYNFQLASVGLLAAVSSIIESKVHIDSLR